MKNPMNLLEDAAESGALLDLLSEYLRACHGNSPGKSVGSFPNLAGFCRFLGVGTADSDRLRNAYPDLFDRVATVLEDEALNAVLSPAVLAAYLKRRLNYGDKADEILTDAACGEVRLVFEHDIGEDGA